MKLMKTLLAATAVLALAAGAAQAKQLVYCSEASPAHFDPGPTTGGNDFDASSRTIYNRLVEFAPGSTDVIPGLAESWDVSEDGTEITFHLRAGAKFHTTEYFTPTRDLNADDVIFSFERQWKEDNAWFAYLDGMSWDYFQGMDMPSFIKEIRKDDDLTVTFVLNEPNAPMVANLAMDFASIMSKEYADKLEADGNMAALSTQPIGTGPFQFVDYQLDTVIRYAAFPDYWDGKQPIDDLIFAITTDPSVRAQRLLAGECDIMPYPAPADIAMLQGDDNLTVMEQEGLNIGYMSYNVTEAPFDDVNVRKALTMAIDKAAIIEAVYQGAGQDAKNLIPPTMWSYDDSIPADVYDPEKAKQMLADAGVTELTTDLWAMPVSRPYNPNAQRIAELIQADWAAVGVTANIVSYEWTEYRTRGKLEDRKGPFQIGWTGDNGDPDNFFATLFSCSAIGVSNYSSWCNEEFEAVIQEAKTTSDPAKRTELYKKAQEIFKADEPAMTLAHSRVFMPMSNKVQNYKMSPLGTHSFVGVDIAE
ncbi:ABC transporter substrate-binding protein [Devosia sp. J2-20]|jgi:dipeptide transport system substrate-binding protein|uniref:ABC transporter substrate-binding protein n=1 Tax=Devosia litorisediminis TaxID=2829817 RepID=A0A942IEH1_9HYPH|nr:MULTISPECIES: ABC transporter substrate-binding protein [Devosia]MBS3849669.1 ABC transporter substrate-binding protein [Devosia litorisediminis]MCZ4347951.1 ABC transporter substrate-binding protein [Devosia neptuniae]WDR00427.1 ABC transporter substrate-binding protein [Devosia sp. J2-20]|tara:strand:- start:4299 stop:5894 length:1596 start_codon:yes stop_codon:yes gene_type:complete